MTSISIKELASRLKENLEEKQLYFSKLSEPKALKPLIEEGVMTFDDSAYWAVLDYLNRIFNDTNKNTILELIDNNFKTEIKTNYFDMKNLVEIFKKCSIQEIETLDNLENIFKSDNNLLITKYLLECNDINLSDVIIEKCLYNLIQYNATTSYFGIKYAYPKFDYYVLRDIFLFTNYNVKLKEVLKKNNITQTLINWYKNIAENYEDISPLNKQYFGEIFEDKIDKYDSRSILLDFIAINLQTNHSKKILEDLLSSDILMFKKLAYHIISIKFDEYKDLFVEHFKTMSIDEIYKIKYEILTIFEKISDEQYLKISTNENLSEQDEQINGIIETKLQEAILDNGNTELKYLLLHGLKKHPKFQDEFRRLYLKHNKIEISHPKLFFSNDDIPVKNIQSVSPVTESDFNNMTIEEQINLINNFKENLFDIDNEKVQSEYKLNELFGRTFASEAEKYLQNESLKHLIKPNAIAALYSQITTLLTQNKLSNKIDDILDIIKNYLNTNLYNSEVKNLDIESSKLLGILLSKYLTPDNSSRMESIVEFLIENNINDTEPSYNIVYDAASQNLSIYLKLWMYIIAKNNSYNKSLREFKDKYFKPDGNILFKHQIFAYYEGFYYSYINPHPDYTNSNPILQKAFVEGCINNSQIDAFEDAKEIIFKFMTEFSDITLQNLIYNLVYIKFELENDELYEKYYNNKIYKPEFQDKFLSSIIYPKRRKYNKDKVFKYIEKNVSNEYTNAPILLQIYNEYYETGDFIKYNKTIMNILKKYSDKVDTSSQLTEFEDTITNLSIYLKQQIDCNNENKIKIHNIILELIRITQYNSVYYTTANTFKNILVEYQNKFKNSQDDISDFYQRIIKTKGLIQFSNYFDEFYKK